MLEVEEEEKVLETIHLSYQKVDIEIQFSDLIQAFDTIWYAETMNDMWETMQNRDDKFALISEMNAEVDSVHNEEN